jgi:ATP-dependent helicase Lhr and Lhr-like helicase
VLASIGELSPAALAQTMLTLAPFRSISQADFRQLLRHLIEIDHLEKTAEGGLIIGLEGEKIARNFKFYAIFPDAQEYIVKQETQAIGSIIVPPQEGDRFSLAGRIWEVIEVNSKKRMISVKPTKKSATSSSWRGTTGDIHTRVLQRMRQILQESTQYSYLQEGAKQRLHSARELARSTGLLNSLILPIDADVCCIFPWAGTTAFRTLERFLRFYCKEALGLKSIKARSPYFLTVRMGKCQLDSLEYEIRSLAERRLNPDDLLDPEEIPNLQKYDPFIPPDLLRKSFVTDYLNLQELAQVIQPKSSQ